MLRHSSLSLVICHLNVDGASYFLFRRHAKWGDWGLVGGHVEPGEEGDWGKTAVREADEEMAPLVHGIDFTVLPLLSEPLAWGPVRSRSAGGRLTCYEAQYFSLGFVTDSGLALARLPARDFVLIPKSEIEASTSHEGVSDTMYRLANALPGGVGTIPTANQKVIRRSELTITCSPGNDDPRHGRYAHGNVR